MCALCIEYDDVCICLEISKRECVAIMTSVPKRSVGTRNRNLRRVFLLPHNRLFVPLRHKQLCKEKLCKMHKNNRAKFTSVNHIDIIHLKKSVVNT